MVQLVLTALMSFRQRPLPDPPVNFQHHANAEYAQLLSGVPWIQV